VNGSWLVTGALGCIGAWTLATLAREGSSVVALNRGTDDSRLRLIATPQEIERISFVRGDVTDLTCIESVMDEYRVTNIVHLAALQVPFCRADPPLGSAVNVTGTVNIFEAARRRELQTTVAYASSAAVYDFAGTLAPKTIYGVYKIANEGCARVYWEEAGVASIGLRPLTVYGPGRDRGMTAAPTEASAAAVKGQPFHIPFGGRTQLHYAPDVARAFIAAARRPANGAEVYNLGGPDTAIADLVAMIAEAVPGACITFDEAPLPFPARLPEPDFDTTMTPLGRGVAETVRVFKNAMASRGGAV